MLAAIFIAASTEADSHSLFRSRFDNGRNEINNLNRDVDYH